MNELSKIKRKYGESMMHLCRKLFPTILNEEGKLISILDNNFGNPKYLYEDIKAQYCKDNFRDFIYQFYEGESKKVITDKTPFELLNLVGYDLYECKTEDDIQSFKKYYDKSEILCTIKNKNRLKSCYVFFAVKKDVDNIKRDNFKNPKRDDQYGTSVISIQFSRGVINTLSIKNRYNHTVNNPDATFNNDLENIVPGLSYSFEKYYGFNINQNNSVYLGLGYVKADDKKYYKYNMEINNVYYCPDNIIIKNGKVIKDYIDKEKYLLIDNFIVDLQNDSNTSKSVFSYEDTPDSFTDGLANFDKILITKNEDKTRVIELLKKGQENVEIKIDSYNNIIGYTNPNLTKIGDDFLRYNEKLEKLSIDNVEKIGANFLTNNDNMEDLRIPNVFSIEEGFLNSAASIKSITLDNVKYISYDFISYNTTLEYMCAPNLEVIGDSFLELNTSLKSLVLPKVTDVGNRFLSNNNILNYLEMPNIEDIGSDFLENNQELVNINFPKIAILSNGFLKNNIKIRNINIPMVKIIGYKCLSNASITNLSLPNTKTIGDSFMENNRDLETIYAPKLISIGNKFLSQNRKLKFLSLKSVEFIGYKFMENNEIIEQIYLPKCYSIGHSFLMENKRLKQIIFPMLKKTDDNFLFFNKIVNYIYMPNLEEIGHMFLYNNKCLRVVSLPNIKWIGYDFLRKNENLEYLYLPNLNFIQEKNQFIYKFLNENSKKGRKVLEYNLGIYNKLRRNYVTV